MPPRRDRPRVPRAHQAEDDLPRAVPRQAGRRTPPRPVVRHGDRHRPAVVPPPEPAAGAARRDARPPRRRRAADRLGARRLRRAPGQAAARRRLQAARDAAVRVLLGRPDAPARARRRRRPLRPRAAAWNRKGAAAVTADERGKTKQLCYGLLYGMGVEKLGAGLGVSAADARHLKPRFLEAFPGSAATSTSSSGARGRRGAPPPTAGGSARCRRSVRPTAASARAPSARRSTRCCRAARPTW